MRDGFRAGWCAVSGLAGDRGHPGVPGEQGVQYVEDIVAVFAGGVDVAADVEAVPGGVVAGSRPEIFCWVLFGRSPDSLMLFVGHTPVSVVNRRTSASRSRQNSSMSRPGCCLVLFFGPGMRGTSASATVTARRNCRWRGSRMAAGIASRPSSLAWLRAWMSLRSASCAWAGQCVPG